MEDPWPSAPWLLPFLCTFDVCLFTTGSDCPLVIAGVDFLSKQGDDVRDPGWDLANFEICWKAAAAHPTFFQLIFKCVLFSLRTVELNCLVENNLRCCDLTQPSMYYQYSINFWHTSYISDMSRHVMCSRIQLFSRQINWWHCHSLTESRRHHNRVTQETSDPWATWSEL